MTDGLEGMMFCDFLLAECDIPKGGDFRVRSSRYSRPCIFLR
jgi:hypothetical protein